MGTATTTSTIATKKSTTIAIDAEPSFNGTIAHSDENDHHEVVLRMDPEGFDFESRPTVTEASLV